MISIGDGDYPLVILVVTTDSIHSKNDKTLVNTAGYPVLHPAAKKLATPCTKYLLPSMH